MRLNGKLTRVQQRMWTLLSDGMQHSKAELHDCLHDELGPYSNIKYHLCDLRRKLPAGYLINCISHGRGRVSYQLVRSITPSNTGRR